MAVSQVSLCNAALVLLGADTIMSLNEDSQEAKLCATRYETVRDEVLCAFPWAPALKRAQLSRGSSAPLFEFAYSYPLPSDCLRVLQMQEQDIYAWREVAGHALETDAEVCLIQYIARISDVTQMTPLLRRAIAMKLASDIAYALTNSTGWRDFAAQQYSLTLSEAATEDAARQRVQMTQEDSWLEARS